MSDIVRPYTKEDVDRLRGSMPFSLVEVGNSAAIRLRVLLEERPYVHALGALTGNQAMQMVKAGLEAIYCSGWQVAADNNISGEMYPDQSLYPCNSVPELVKRINKTLKRADQIEWAEGYDKKAPIKSWNTPIIADAEAGFGGALNAYEIMMAMIEAGAACVHFEDQLSSAKKCGHLGGKVLVPASEMIKKLIAARLATDVANTNTLIIARTDANSAKLLTTDCDREDWIYLDSGDIEHQQKAWEAGNDPRRTSEGFYRITGGIDMAINRGLQYAPYCDMIWCETSKPDLDEARKFAEAIHAKYPGKWLAYNCSPSFNWRKNLGQELIQEFQQELGKMGYKFQFVTLAGFHSLNKDMFQLAKEYKDEGMAAYARMQDQEFWMEKHWEYTAVKHQREVGTGFFDLIAQTVDKEASTVALHESTEKEQF